MDAAINKLVLNGSTKGWCLANSEENEGSNNGGNAPLTNERSNGKTDLSH